MDSDPPEVNVATAETEVEAIEARLLVLELEKQSLLERKRQLVAAEQVNERTMPAIEVPVSTGDKIALFRSLFRGRDDVHALRWENTQGRRARLTPQRLPRNALIDRNLDTGDFILKGPGQLAEEGQ